MDIFDFAEIIFTFDMYYNEAVQRLHIMNKGYITVVFLLLMHIVVVHAQSGDSNKVTAKKELSDKDFQSVKLKYLKMLDSPNWKESDSITKLLARTFAGLNAPDFWDDKLFHPWIKRNFHLFTFTSMDEVVSLVERWRITSAASMQENIEMYNIMGNASEQQIGEILAPYIRSTEAYFER